MERSDKCDKVRLFIQYIRKNLIPYLGRIFICLIANTIVVVYNSKIISFLKENLIDTKDLNDNILYIIIYFTTNVLSLLLSDFVICLFSAEDDGCEDLRGKYSSLHEEYKALQGETKFALNYFISILNNKEVKPEDVKNYINKFNKHIDEVDLKTMKLHCENMANREKSASFFDILKKHN